MDINYSNPVNFKLKDYDEKPEIYNLGFREYDARWLYPEQINLAGVQKIGLGLGKLINQSDNNGKISVGHDFRSYSEEIKEALIGGLIASGVDVYDVGLTISPGAYFSQYFLDCDNVAMVTASHNPNGWTGIKMGNEKTLTFGPDLINNLKKLIEEKDNTSNKNGKYNLEGISTHKTKTIEQMKKIEAVIRKSKFHQVKDALHKAGINFFSYWDVTGLGNEKEGHVYRGVAYNTSDIQRRYLSIVVNDEFEKAAIDAILAAAATGAIGDGKIFVSTIEESYRIRTGEKGGDTLN